MLLDGLSERAVPMLRDGDHGHFATVVPDVREGQRYALRLDGGEPRPDPCSLWQPDGVAGPSAVVRPDEFRWTDDGWVGVAREDLAIYELHVGTFTPEGTFEGIIPRLPVLRELGITAIELMPISQFPGARNWGYDGVLPYAAQNTYGGPHGLQRLVDAAHGAGLAVILDVVYNHLGPEGNYLHEFGPYFTDKYKTPWGKAINYDDRECDGVRDWVLDNARMWLDEFHLDGLRLDAVHAIYDTGARHILRAIREVADDVSRRSGRTLHVIAESDLNDPRVVLPAERGGFGLDGQWADDFHHAVHALLTGERRGYYADFGTVEQVAQAMQTPFVYAWDYSSHRGRKHGAPVPEDVRGDRFLVCIQNHDQVGNRARGDRLGALLGTPEKQRLAACLMLFSPYVPLLFMGEEYGETNPFPFFCSFCGKELVQAVREGRKREFADFVTSADEVPLPDAPETFEGARLSWSWPPGSFAAGLRNLYADLLAARKRWPALRDYSRGDARIVAANGPATVLELRRGGRQPGQHDALRVYFNLSAHATELPSELDGDDGGKPLFSSEWPRYAGHRETAERPRALFPFECYAVGPVTPPST